MLRILYQSLKHTRHIDEIADYQKDFLRIYPPSVLAKLKAGDKSWEEMVPPEVVQIIKEREVFGYRAAVAALTPTLRPKSASPSHGFRYMTLQHHTRTRRICAL